jgi:3,4-dihydroxy 2-butanone 4-phosphate synthase/GTP cyclohydrolase II
MHVVDQVMDVPMTTRFGRFLTGAVCTLDERTQIRSEHVLLYLGLGRNPCNLRLNSACFTSGLFGDVQCDCTWQLEYALGYIQRYRQGLVVYHMHDEGRGHGILNKLRSFGLDDRFHAVGAAAYTRLGLVPDAREFESAITILRGLGIRSVNLISNNLAKRDALRQAGIEVVTMVSAICPAPTLRTYYDWKRKDFQHHV